MNQKLLSLGDVARLLDVSESTVRRWLKAEKLHGQQVGVQWRFDAGEVRAAFDRGDLAGAHPIPSERTSSAMSTPPDWAASMIRAWTSCARKEIDQTDPDQVVVNDRRGAKVWSLLMKNQFEWGRNLWHSKAVDLMWTSELRDYFAGKRVLIFDEMMQHGGEMYELRRKLENTGAAVRSLVCVRRRSHMDSGETREYKAVACEDLDDEAFSQRATMISRLMTVLDPPLDVAHPVIRGTLRAGLGVADLLERLAKFGVAFIVREPEPHSGGSSSTLRQRFYAITLDRPQFFDTTDLVDLTDLVVSWSGPCKIRIYIDPETNECFCSFIVFPSLKGTSEAWNHIMLRRMQAKREHPGSVVSAPAFEDVRVDLLRLYEHICVDLALELLDDFLTSGVAAELGLDFPCSPTTIDAKHLRATFGPSRGDEIRVRVMSLLRRLRPDQQLFPRMPVKPPPLFVRAPAVGLVPSYDAFECRTELLRVVPRKSHEHALSDRRRVDPQPVTYTELLDELDGYSESAVGRVLDYELDWGTVKPDFCVTLSPQKGEGDVD